MTNEETSLRIDRQVAIAGRAISADGGPLAGATVRLTEMPPEWKQVVDVQRALAVENPGTAMISSDGLFYFLDLPTGKYGVAVRFSGQSTATVVRDDKGRVEMFWVDLVSPGAADGATAASEEL